MHMTLNVALDDVCRTSICIAVDSTTVRKRAFESTNTAAVNKLMNRRRARADEAKSGAFPSKGGLDYYVAGLLCRN